MKRGGSKWRKIKRIAEGGEERVSRTGKEVKKGEFRKGKEGGEEGRRRKR